MTSTSAALDINPMSQPAPISAAVLELLASRICHDLISPVGAVNNGVEFLEEMGADAGAEAIQLIAHSARQASVRLQAFRICYGTGGRDSNIKPEDIKKAFEALTPGRQRGYLFHFGQAKLSKTRSERVKKNIPRILEGKGLDDE